MPLSDVLSVGYIDRPIQAGIPSAKFLESSVVNAIQRKLDNLLDKDPILFSVFSKLQKASIPGVIFGGWVRDQFISINNGVELQPRDIDIVVDLPTNMTLDAIISEGYTKTVFGGMATKTSTTSLDIWAIRDTFLIRSLLLEPSLDMLPYTTVFRINSVVFYPMQLTEKPAILESGFVDAIRIALVSFQSSRIPLPHVQVARAVIYSAKLSFGVHRDVRNFIRDVCTSSVDIRMVIEGLHKYCPLEIKDKAISILHEILGEVDNG